MQYTKQIPESTKLEPAKYVYNKSSYTKIFNALQSLRKDETFCDIKLKTEDNKIIFAHKVVLASASPYFHAMFTHFAERRCGLVEMRHLDSTALQPLVNFIYSGAILVTEKNVMVLLPAANLLQLQEVKEACCNFLQSQLCPTNCIGINVIADLHSCTTLLTSSKLYIQQHFSEIVGEDEFLSLSSDKVVELISSEQLVVPSEEKVFECVIRWVKHELNSRQSILPQLMEHVRLPLTPKNFILKKVFEEPLIQNCLKCKDYIIEALHFHLLDSDELIPQNIRNKPRLGDKVILVIGGLEAEASKCIEWYDPKMNRWLFGPKIITPRCRARVAVVNDYLVFAVGGIVNHESSLRSVNVLDLSLKSPCWKPTADLLVKRTCLGVGVINANLYAVGGLNDGGYLNSAEIFDCNTQEWRMISNMPTGRGLIGVGVLNNLLYVVGGCNSPVNVLSTVECYNPSLDKWTPVANMCVRRYGAGVGVLDGVMYAVGGYNNQLKFLRSVEAYRPSTGVWTTIADMHLPRLNAGVVALDGLLYVVGGLNVTSVLNSIECYCPKNNTWTIVTASMNVGRTRAGVVVIDRPLHFKTCYQL